MKNSVKVLLLGAFIAMASQPVFAGDGPAPAEKPKAAAAKETKKQDAAPGAIVVETVKAKAKVTAVDAAKRLVTFEADGKSRSVVCGPEVKNFDQIKVGDQLVVTFVDALAVYLQKDGGEAGVKDVTTVSLAPKGAKPGALVTETVTLKAKVEKVDAKKGVLVLTAPDGSLKVLKVAKDARKGLKNLKKGDDIVAKHTEALAVVIEAPKK